MYKIIRLPKVDSHGEPTFSRIHPGVLEKTASNLHPDMQSAISNLQPREDGIYVLVNGLGSGEAWGPNVNGDYFPENALVTDNEGYGYTTFEKFAFPYAHHVNKDPKGAIGERVIKAVWNDIMKRVELLYFLTRAKCPDVVKRVEDGDMPAVSMGCKVPYDVCSICNNKAKTTAEYCGHLKTAMNQTMEDGRRVYAINTMPKFFDISHVTIGADKTARVLMKVASHHESVIPSAMLAEEIGYSYSEDDDLAKVASDVDGEAHLAGGSNPEVLRKFASHGIPVLNAVERDFSDDVLEKLAGYPLSETISTLAHMGMVLKPREFSKIASIKLECKESVSPSDCQLGNVNSGIVALMRKEGEERSGFPVYLSERAIKIASSSSDDLAGRMEDNSGSLDFVNISDDDNLLKVSDDLNSPQAVEKVASLYDTYRSQVRSLDIEKFASAITGDEELWAFYNGSGRSDSSYLANLMLGECHAEKTAVKRSLIGGGAGLAVLPLTTAHLQREGARRRLSKSEELLANSNVGNVGGLVGAYGGAKAGGKLDKLKAEKLKKEKAKAKAAKKTKLKGKLGKTVALGSLLAAGAIGGKKLMDKKSSVNDKVPSNSQSADLSSVLSLVKQAARLDGPDGEAATVCCLVIGGQKLGLF